MIELERNDESVAHPFILWYRQPAQHWYEALPLGNGRQGAMVWGVIERERFSLDESTCWAGEPSLENNDPSGPQVVRQIRQALFRNEIDQAERLAEGITGSKLNYGTNLPLGNLFIEFPHSESEITGYRRELDLDRAISGVTYLQGQDAYRRQAFASHPDQVIVVRLSCDRPEGLSCRVVLDGAENPFETRTEGADTIILDGQARETTHSDGKTGVAFHGRVRVIASSGTTMADSKGIVVQDATAVTLLIALGTTFDGAEPVAICERQIQAAASKSYQDLLSDHVADHQGLFRRVDLDLSLSPHPDWPTDARVRAVDKEHTDPQLAALLFQFGRYLLIGSSRSDSPVPAHLVGLWNDNVACRISWTCDYHLDINTQMNYWIAETANLADCAQPLLRWIEERLVPSGRHTAKTLYGLRGWMAHIVSNVWGYSAPGWDLSWGFFATGGVWIASHLWDHYAFGGDRDFLADHAYPILREAAEFYLDYLSEHPANGWLVTSLACSPENHFFHEGERHTLAVGPTVDRVLLYELFTQCIQASQILGGDSELRARLHEARDGLPPLQVGKHGQLQEWLEDYEEAIPRHRHTSHLLALFPFDQITPQDSPALAGAARVSVERRLDAPGGFESYPWARNNIASFYARLQDGEAALRSLDSLFWNQSEGTMFVGTKLAPRNAYEMDYNTGATASIAEMLLQSHAGQISLLPALPRAWPEGCVRGLCARGGFEVDIAWSDGKLTGATIRSKLGNVCTVRSSAEVYVIVEGERAETKRPGHGLVEFKTVAGASYRLLPAL